MNLCLLRHTTLSLLSPWYLGLLLGVIAAARSDTVVGEKAREIMGAGRTKGV